MANVTNYLAQALVRLSSQTGAVAFENSFQQLQKTVIGRTNDKIDKLHEAHQSDSRERNALVKNAQSLQKQLGSIQTYIGDNQSNSNRLESILSKITELQFAFGTDGESADVTDADITQFNQLRDELATQVNNLYYISHPDVVKPYAIIHLKEKLNSIKELTPVVGASTDAANQEVSDFLSELSLQTSNAMDATRSTISMGSKLSIRYADRLSDLKDELDSKNTAAQTKLNQDIENLKIDAANFLQAISLTYEAKAYSTNYISNALSTGIQPPKDSILNIFS